MEPFPDQGSGWRILVVEDNDRLAAAMKRLLGLVARIRRVQPEPLMDRATSADEARRQMACWPYHLISVDLRLPAGAGDSAVQAVNGRNLALECLGPVAPLAKVVLYAGNLEDEYFDPRGAGARELEEVDGYLKDPGGDQDPTDHSRFERLSPRGWAERVMDYLCADQLRLPATVPWPPRETLLGVLLSGGGKSLPPPLARCARQLGEHWPGHEEVDPRAIDAAHRFVNYALRLAVAQTAILIADVKPEAAPVPPGEGTESALRVLDAWTTQHADALAQWAWSHYLHSGTLAAFREAEAQRVAGDRAFSLVAVNLRERWARLLPVLRQLLSLAGFWSRCPLCLDPLQEGSSWSASLYVGTGLERPRRAIPFGEWSSRPEGQIWQVVYRIPTDGAVAPAARLVTWTNWLQMDPAANGRVRLATHRNRNEGQVWTYLDEGGVAVTERQ